MVRIKKLLVVQPQPAVNKRRLIIRLQPGQVGIELGKGRALTEILAGMRMVAEGVGTTAALLALAREAKVELPITQQVAAILHEGKAPREAIRDIMERPQRPE